MNSTFWSNTIWYVLLLITSLISIALIIRKTPTPKFTVAFLVSVIGFTFVLEAILALALEAYIYHPKIVADLFLDSVFGNYFSQLSLSSTVVLISTFNLSYLWCLGFAITYYFIEELFVHLSIFEHFWYRSVYTIVGFILLTWVVRGWFRKVTQERNRLLDYVSQFLAVFAAYSFTIILTQRLLGVQIFKGHIYADMSKDHTTTGLLYQFIVINALIILSQSKLRIGIKGIVLIVLGIVQYLLCQVGFIYITPGWFVIVTTFDLGGCYYLISLFQGLYAKRKQET